MGTKVENNKVKLMGRVSSGFEFSHEVFNEGFYMMYVDIQRLSDSIDTIPVMVSERMLDTTKDFTGQYVSIEGQFRSYNKGIKSGENETRKKLVLYMFAQDVQVHEEGAEENTPNADVNSVELDGFICREVKYRKTPLGREIADLLLAVNRPYGKSDYLPCICWGRNARFAEGLTTGTRIKVSGRIQSRHYVKKLSEEEVEERVAYEISINKLKVVNEADEADEADEVDEVNGTVVEEEQSEE